MYTTNKIWRALLAGCIACTLVGCESQDVLEVDSEKTYIDISQEIINLAAPASSKEVEVMTNAKSWIARESQDYDWIELTQAGSVLIVSAQTNTMGSQRTAYIEVEAAGVSQRLSVHQEAAEQGQLILSQQRLSSSGAGGDFHIAVSETSAGWSIEGANLYPWLTVSRTGNSISVRVAPNDEPRQRIGKFYVTTQSAQPLEVVVAQEGKLSYAFPYLPTSSISQADVLRDAQARGFLFLRKEVKEQTGDIHYYFNPADRFGSEVYYRFRTGIDRYLSFVVESKGSLYGESEEFDSFLLNQGFIKTEDKLQLQTHLIRYYKVYDHYIVYATVSVVEQALLTRVSYVIKDRQPGAMKSFEKLPYRNLSLFGKATFAEVKQWEESDGECIERNRVRGSKSPNIIAQAEFTSVTKRETHMSSTYYFYEQQEIGKLFQRVDIYRGVSKALWRDHEGAYHPTDELLELLANDGFEMKNRTKGGDNQEWISFVDDNRRLAMLFSAVEQPNGGAYLAVAVFFIADAVNGQSIESLALRNAQSVIAKLH